MFRFAEKKWSEKPIDRLNNQVKPMLKPLNLKNNSENPVVSFNQQTSSINTAKPLNQAKKNLSEITQHEDLLNYIQHFDKCSIKNNCRNTVIFSGKLDSVLMIIGEAPGEEEDKQGIPFVGTSGNLLRSIFHSLNFEMDNFYLTNCVFWRPPMNRKPTMDEVLLCKPMILKQIEILKPKCILLLGAVALNMLFGEEFKITAQRGKKMFFNNIPVFATFHPYYILKMPKQKEIVVKDISNVIAFISKL